MRAIPRAHPRGARALSVRPSPRHRGTQEQEHSKRLLRQGLPRSSFASGSLSAAARARRKKPEGARPRGGPSLWLLSLGQARESNWPPGMADKPHMDVSRVSRNAEDQLGKQTPNQHHPHPTLPLKERTKRKNSGLRRNDETEGLRWNFKMPNSSESTKTRQQNAKSPRSRKQQK